MGFPTPPSRDETESKSTTAPTDTNQNQNQNGDDEPSFGDDMNQHELKQAIETYQEWCAEHYPIDVDLDGIPTEISTRMKSTAGKVCYNKGDFRVKYIRYALKAYQKWGWDELASTIRHELIHVHTVQNYEKGGHGRLFKRMVPKMDTSRHCETFAEDDAKYILFCKECDAEVVRRFKMCKSVKNPGRYRSKCCQAPLRVEDA